MRIDAARDTVTGSGRAVRRKDGLLARTEGDCFDG